jgi:hypothetical protein
MSGPSHVTGSRSTGIMRAELTPKKDDPKTKDVPKKVADAMADAVTGIIINSVFPPRMEPLKGKSDRDIK